MQVQGLSRIAQSTWGATFHKSKTLYSTIVRPVLTYGSPVWAEVGPGGKIPERIVRPLRSIQRNCLKIVTGAYKSTSTRVLEHETATLPIEIFLKQQRLQYLGRTKDLPVQKTIQSACNKIKLPRKGREDIRTVNRRIDLANWTGMCGEQQTKKTHTEIVKVMAYQEWAKSWAKQKQTQKPRQLATADSETWRAAKFYQSRESGRQKLSFQGSPFFLYHNPTRAQSSLAMQIRSENMGLNSYLHKRKVPEVSIPGCPCGYKSQNLKHMIMCCPRWSNGRAEIWGQAKDRSYEAMINNPGDIKRITQWILNQGWIEQYLSGLYG